MTTPSFRAARIPFLGAVLVMLLLSPPHASAQQKKGAGRKAPVAAGKGSTSPSRAFPAVTSDTLSNGLRVLYCRVNELPLMEITLMIDAGILRENPGAEGLSQLMGKLIFSGTPTRPRNKIIADLSTQGSTLTSSTGYENTRLIMRCLSKNVRQSIDILADVVANATPTERDVTSTVQGMHAALAASAMNAGEFATLSMLAGLFGEGHPIARPPYGSQEGISRLTLAEVTAFYSTYYRPNNAVLLITGDANYSALKSVLEDRFSQWMRAAVPPRALPAPPSAVRPVLAIRQPEQRYATLRLGVRCPSIADADAPALLVLNQILGGAKTSRLGRMFWSEHLVMPTFFSTVGFSAAGGYLAILGSTPAARADSVLLWMDDVLHTLGKGPVSPGELAEAKRVLTAGSDFDPATNRDMQAHLQEAVQHGLPPNSAFVLQNRIAAVRADEVTALARRLFAKERRSLVLSGDADRFLPALRQRFGDDVALFTPAPQQE